MYVSILLLLSVLVLAKKTITVPLIYNPLPSSTLYEIARGLGASDEESWPTRKLMSSLFYRIFTTLSHG